MHDYQQEFIAFARDKGVLRFGEFQLKSGRLSPYFFNSGAFNSGSSLACLGRYYAAALHHSGLEFDMLYGPAYKGIPLVCAVAIAYAQEYDRDLPYAFNRKEAKDHGEGGALVGAPLEGKVVIVDDVVSAGTSVRESIELINAAGATPVGVAVSLDRQERGEGELSAIMELEQTFDLKVTPIITLQQIIESVTGDSQDALLLQRIKDYQCRYGVAKGRRA